MLSGYTLLFDVSIFSLHLI